MEFITPSLTAHEKRGTTKSTPTRHQVLSRLQMGLEQHLRDTDTLSIIYTWLFENMGSINGERGD